MTPADRDLLALYYPTILAAGRWAARRERDPDAEDVAHDAALEVCRRIRQYDPARGAFKTWVFQLARSAARHRRLWRAAAKRRRRPVPFADCGEPADPRAADPAAEAGRRELAAAVGAALGGLTPGQKAAVERRFGLADPPGPAPSKQSQHQSLKIALRDLPNLLAGVRGEVE